MPGCSSGYVREYLLIKDLSDSTIASIRTIDNLTASALLIAILQIRSGRGAALKTRKNFFKAVAKAPLKGEGRGSQSLKVLV